MGMIMQNGKLFSGEPKTTYKERVLWSGPATPPNSGTDITLTDAISNYDEIVFKIDKYRNTYAGENVFTVSLLTIGEQYISTIYPVSYQGAYWDYLSDTSIKIRSPSSTTLQTYVKIIGIKYGDVVKKEEYHRYSTEERVVGEWIDGRAVYEKTLNVGAVSSGTTFAHGITNLDWIIDYSMFGLYGGSDKLVSPATGSSSSIGIVISRWDSTNITFTKGNLSSNFSGCYCTIRYIKTASS